MRDRSRYLPAKDRTKIILSAGLHRVLNVYREHGGGRGHAAAVLRRAADDLERDTKQEKKLSPRT